MCLYIQAIYTNVFSSQNDYLKSKRKGHYNTMVKQADQQNNAVYSCSGVSKEEVEAAKADKMDLAHTLQLDLLSKIFADVGCYQCKPFNIYL